MDRAAPTQPHRLKKSRRSPVSTLMRLLSFVLILIICLILMGLAYEIWQIPIQTERDFGPPSPTLSFQQQILYGYRLMSNRDNLLNPLDPRGQSRPFEVALGEPVNSISYRLESDRLVANADAFRTFLIYSGLDTGVQAGKYQLSPAMNAVEIAQTLQDAVPTEVSFNILPGWRIEEIAAALPTSGLGITPEEFLRLAQQPPAGLAPDDVEQPASLEGFLMPGAYTLNREITAQELLQTFLTRFDESITPNLREAFRNQGLDLYQAVTLASIIQREAVIESEQPFISSVFYNRLASGMRLESDPTVQYALGYDPADQTWWKNPLSLSDLKYDSDYNTYVYAGLPPGPISNPGVPALRAVGYPAQTGYFYFRAQCDGSGRHFFAVTYEEHLNNACR